MTIYDNDSIAVSQWLRDLKKASTLRIATGYVTLDGLCLLTEMVPEDVDILLLAGRELIPTDGTTIENLAELQADSDNLTRRLTILYDRIRDSLSVRYKEGLHSKIYLADSEGLVGSSNLTRSGLCAGIEFNTELTNEAQSAAVTWFDELWRDSESRTEPLVESIERSPHGVHVVSVPISDPGQLQRVSKLDTNTCRDLVHRSLPSQIAKLEAEIDIMSVNPALGQTTIGRYTPKTPAQQYLERLLVIAATDRQASRGFQERLDQITANGLPSYNPRLWKLLRKRNQDPEIPVNPTGLAWLLEWFCRDPSMEGLPSRPNELRPIDEPVLMVKPWEHQRQAIDAWRETGSCGIVEMATATGKTVVGLDAICQTARSVVSSSQRILVVCHTRALMDQWVNEIVSKLGLSTRLDVGTVIFDSGEIRVTTPQNINSTTDNEFENTSYDLLIVDEVHHYTEPDDGWGQVLTLNYDRFLGLSADTSEFNSGFPAGERLPVVFEYTQADAIDDGIIPEFEWLLHPVTLHPDEQSDHDRLSQNIAATLDNISRDPETAQIESKYDCEISSVSDVLTYVRWVDKVPDTWDHLLRLLHLRRQVIYKSQAAVEATIKLAEDYLQAGIKLIVFTMQQTTADRLARRLHPHFLVHADSHSDQASSIAEFEAAESGVLIGVKMLDEGVDVPNVDVAINTASTKTRLQLLQRQGRILRREGHHRPIFHHFVHEDEIEYYRRLESTLPTVEPNPIPVIETRLPERVGSVRLGEIYRSLSPTKQRELSQTNVDKIGEYNPEAWWLQIYLEEYSEHFDSFGS